jgi:hypothetical protein
MTDIEHQRREFKRDNAALYAYITAHEVAKALDSAGDMASGAATTFQAANRLWSTSTTHKGLASRLRDHTRTNHGDNA